MILDITAGNRHIWSGWMPEINNNEPIIYFDIEKNLKIPPDIICDNKKLPIRNKIADVVIFDPPCWRFGHSKWYGDPQEKKKIMFYGNYINRSNLMRLLVGAIKTTRRVLKKNGGLFFKWSDGHIPLERVLPLFTQDFEETDREERQSKWGKTKNKTYWITFKIRSSLRRAKNEEM